MKYVELPIYNASLYFAMYIETIVKHFNKYEMYTIGEDLRNYSKDFLFCVHRANMADDKLLKLEVLRDKSEELKMLLQLCKELKASFYGHCKHANSYNLMKTVGKIDENNSFDYNRA